MKNNIPYISRGEVIFRAQQERKQRAEIMLEKEKAWRECRYDFDDK